MIPACDVVGISKRTFERWCKHGSIEEDKRKTCIRPKPKNKLYKEEYQSVLKTVIKPEFSDLPASQIVLKLADRGIYFKLYMFIDIYSRKIVAWEVWNEENGELA